MWQQANEIAKAHWDRLHSSYVREEIPMDDWLTPFLPLIDQCPTPIIDLGCGSGNDTKYLIEHGKSVIACDYAPNAIENIRKNFPHEAEALCFDMTQGLPFPDDFSGLILADLSLHYFSEETTAAILKEIRRVLQPEGILLFRVNSLRDVHHGAGQGTELERHFYLGENGHTKRFFDLADIHRVFRDWQLLYLREETMTRYELPKVLWIGMCRAEAPA